MPRLMGRPEVLQARSRVGRALLAPFEGAVPSVVYSMFRVGVAALVLIRTSDVLRPVLELDHHGWVRGLEHAPWSDPVAAPRLHAALVPLFDVAAEAGVASMLVIVRTVAALATLLGVGGRAAPLLMGLSGWALMAADRFRYLHHMQLLWLSCLLLALMPVGAPFHRRPNELAPRWPLTLARFHVLVVYAAAGIAKLTPAWLSGSDLVRLADAGLVSRSFVELAGAQPLAVMTVVIELGLVPLLLSARTRSFGLVLGLLFHGVTGATMMVSIFPALMALHLMLFAPSDRPESTPAAARADAA